MFGYKPTQQQVANRTAVSTRSEGGKNPSIGGKRAFLYWNFSISLSHRVLQRCLALNLIATLRSQAVASTYPKQHKPLILDQSRVLSKRLQNKDGQTVIPVTVKQVEQAVASSNDDPEILIDGVELTNITMIGMIVNKTELVSHVNFFLDDGTGKINCSRWSHDAHDSKEIEEMRDGMYVRIHGSLKGFNGKKHLMVFSVRPVTDFNEIAYHFIECMYVHLYNTGKQNMQGYGQTQPQPQPSHPSVSNPAMGTNGRVMNQYVDKVNDLDARVLAYLCGPATDQSEKGASINELAQALRVSTAQIKQSIENLGRDGAVYSTVDDYHYKSSVNG